MGFADKAKKALEDAKDQAGRLAAQHGDKVGGAVDKAGDAVDRRTKGKYASHVDKAQNAAKQATEKLAAQQRPRPGDPATPDHPQR
jgi:hypothetical protein